MTIRCGSVLEEGRVLAADLATWTLAERQRGRISTTAQHLEPACWESGDARLCLQGDRTPARLEGTASLQSLPLAYLRPLLPDTLEADGLVDAQAHVEQDTGGAPTVALTVDTGPMELRTGASAAEPDSLLLGLAPSALEIDLRNTRLTAAVDMPIASGGTISGRLATDGDAGPLAEQTLQGEVRLSVEDMGFLATLVPDVDRAAGALNGRVTISGTVGRPVPDGEFRLTGGALQLVGRAVRRLACRHGLGEFRPTVAD